MLNIYGSASARGKRGQIDIPLPHHRSVASHVSPFRITGTGGGRERVRALGLELNAVGNPYHA